MLKFFLIGFVGVAASACTSLSDPEFIMQANMEKRKQRAAHMPCEEKPLEDHISTDRPIPIAPQVGIRIPLGK